MVALSCFQLAFADGAERTASCACSAVDAGTGINAAGVPLFANGLNRAVGFAQTTVGAFAFVDLVSQNSHLLPMWNGLQTPLRNLLYFRTVVQLLRKKLPVIPKVAGGCSWRFWAVPARCDFCMGNKK